MFRSLLRKRVDAVGETRYTLARQFLRGDGLEVGALHNPLKVARNTRVKFVDRYPLAVLRERYPELSHQQLVEPDIIDNGEVLSQVDPESQDFLVANHFIEHCENPIGAIRNFLRILRPGGILYLAIPDKNRTFDRERSITPFSHLLRDDREGPEWSRREHFFEYALLVDKAPPGDGQEVRASYLMEKEVSIHFHVWDKPAICEFVGRLAGDAGLRFEPKHYVDNGDEAIWILEKGS